MNLQEQNRLRKLSGMSIVKETDMKLSQLVEGDKSIEITSADHLRQIASKHVIVYDDEGGTVKILRDMSPSQVDRSRKFSKSIFGNLTADLSDEETDVVAEVPHLGRVVDDESDLLRPEFPFTAVVSSFGEMKADIEQWVKSQF